MSARLADRIREMTCGCRYDSITSITTHYCARHQPGNSPEPSRSRRSRSRGEREQAATALLGIDVRNVPKSALAVVAFYLAQQISGDETNPSNATDVLWREWRLLHAQGIVAAPCPVADTWEKEEPLYRKDGGAAPTQVLVTKKTFAEQATGRKH